MSFQKIRADIQALSEKKFAVVAKAKGEDRDLSRREELLIDELDGAIQGLRNELEKPQTSMTVSNFGGGSRSSNGPFRSFGEQLRCVVNAGTPSGQADPRLFQAAAGSGLSESVSVDGGFLVQQDFSNELLKSVFETGILASRCRRIQISANSNTLKINGVDETSRASTRYGGILGYWEDEAALKTSSKPKFRQLSLTLKKMIGLCYATDELLQDASALEGVIRQGFISEFGFMLDDGIINGTGAGQPLGILNSGCLVSVGKETGQKAATIVAENIIKMYSRLLPSAERNAVWLINKNCLPQLYMMALNVGTGGAPIFIPQNSMSNSPYNTLLGRPVIPIEQAATLGTVGDIILADLTGGYILAEKAGIAADMSIHVRFVYDESTFRFVMRVDGQPVLAVPLTPYKGSETQSFFIALATRA